MPAIRVRGLRTSYVAPRTTGRRSDDGDLWALLLWTAAGSILAVRLFRWDSAKT